MRRGRWSVGGDVPWEDQRGIEPERLIYYQERAPWEENSGAKIIVRGKRRKSIARLIVDMLNHYQLNDNEWWMTKEVKGLYPRHAGKPKPPPRKKLKKIDSPW